MSDHAAPGHADATDPTHDAGHHDEHGHPGDSLGPVDWRMWGVGLVGVIAALAVVGCAVVATGFVFFDLLP